MDLLLALAIALALFHFGFPLSYYLYLKRRWLNKPWEIRRDPSYKARVSIIIPTYNEALLIESKLDDIMRQNYPKDLVEIIVVDSASTDGTPEAVKK
jgi:cellulose synthase/poly-beta-1,6-N-acetylglucosamine synthase-like glycosyltransferase